MASLTAGSFIAYGLAKLFGFSGMGLGFVCEEMTIVSLYFIILKMHKKARELRLFDFSDINIGYWQQLKSILSYMFTLFPATLTDIGTPLFYGAAIGSLVI